MRLIDADKIKKPIYAEDDNCAGNGMTYDEMVAYNHGINKVWYKIKTAPEVNAGPIIHGKWISVSHKLARICNICYKDEPYKFADEDVDAYNYCPHCGAKMDGEREI
mgnify:CR=1 FL=1